MTSDDENNKEYGQYITVFSLRLYKILKRKNIFPYAIESNREFPQYNVYKYKVSEEVLNTLQQYKAGLIK